MRDPRLRRHLDAGVVLRLWRAPAPAAAEMGVRTAEDDWRLRRFPALASAPSRPMMPRCPALAETLSCALHFRAAQDDGSECGGGGGVGGGGAAAAHLVLRLAWTVLAPRAAGGEDGIRLHQVRCRRLPPGGSGARWRQFEAFELETAEGEEAVHELPVGGPRLPLGGDYEVSVIFYIISSIDYIYIYIYIYYYYYYYIYIYICIYMYIYTYTHTVSFYNTNIYYDITMWYDMNYYTGLYTFAYEVSVRVGSPLRWGGWCEPRSVSLQAIVQYGMYIYIYIYMYIHIHIHIYIYTYIHT